MIRSRILRTSIAGLLLLPGAAWAQTSPAPARASAQSARPAAPSALEGIPFPPVDEVEAAVAAQLRAAQTRIADAASGGTVRDLAEAYGDAGQTLQAYEFMDAAEACFRNASRLTPADDRWPHLRGHVSQQTGRYQEAAELYAAARRLRPDDHVLSLHIGESWLALGRLADARQAFQSALSVFPAAAQAGLGEVALREHKYDEAVTHFNAALERAPAAASIHYSLAMAYRGLGRVDEARAHLDKRGSGGIRAVDPLLDALTTRLRGERALVMQGRRAYESGDLEGASSLFRRAIEDAPSSTAARFNLGLVDESLGDLAGAASQFETVLSLEPDNVDAHVGLGRVFVRLGREADAAAHLRIAFAERPADADVRRALIGTLVRLGRKDEAVSVLEQARSREADDEGVLVALTILLADLERYRDAVSLLEEHHHRFPTRTATATTLARLLAAAPDLSVRNGEEALDVALAIYEREKAPAHAETVALALAEVGRCSEAAEWMRRGIADAEAAGDGSEIRRLSIELPKFAAPSCRPAGR
jgi:tetratricopeptide (TPR) repeat protein